MGVPEGIDARWLREKDANVPIATVNVSLGA
jgi:hypothetical protein